MELSEEARVQRARTFDQIADLYDRGRREPPGWLYDTVFAESRLDTATARVLEIGCGTGTVGDIRFAGINSRGQHTCESPGIGRLSHNWPLLHALFL